MRKMYERIGKEFLQWQVGVEMASEIWNIIYDETDANRM